MADLNRTKKNLSTLLPRYKPYLKNDPGEKIKRMEECIENNFQFVTQIVHEHLGLFDFDLVCKTDYPHRLSKKEYRILLI
jgi:hypothetical protein